MRKVQDDLDLLPHSFSDNPQAGLLALCSEFISETDEYTNGTPNHAAFFQELHNEFAKLAKEIIATRPNFETAPTSSSSGGQVGSMSAFTFTPPSSSLSMEPYLLQESNRNSKSCLKGKKFVFNRF